MRERFQLPVAMWQVQFQLLGGSRRLAIITVLYAMAGILVVASMRVSGLYSSLGAAADRALGFLAWGQALLVVLAGCSAVHKAQLRDYDTKMIESHRLTPLGNLSVTVGYLFGATSRILALFGMNLIFGGVLCVIAGAPVQDWAMGNTLLLSGAIMLWAIVVFSGMSMDKPVNPTGVLVVGGIVGSMGILMLPGAGLLSGAYSVAYGIGLLTGSAGSSPAAAGAMLLANFILTVFWLSMAATKYRRPDLPAFTAFRGTLLLLVWLVPATAGIHAYELIADFSPMSTPDPAGALAWQWAGTMIVALLFAAAAVGGTVQCRTLVRRGAAPRDWSDNVPGVVVALVSAGLICLVMALLGLGLWRELLPDGSDATPFWTWSISGLVCVLAMLSLWGLFAGVYAVMGSAKWIVAIFFMFAWAMPPLIDLISTLRQDTYSVSSSFSWLFGCSPIGTILGTWTDITLDIVPGLIVQAIIAAGCCAFALSVRRKGTKPTSVPAGVAIS